MSIEPNNIEISFKNIVADFKAYLRTLQNEFATFDEKNNNRQARIEYVLNRKEDVYSLFDRFFMQIWPIVKDLDKGVFKKYQQYFQNELGDPLLNAEINNYIKAKPLGYPGDFVMMNYIYDFHSDFLGQKSLEMLINHYTTHIPISNSNIQRKQYFKEKIIGLLSSTRRVSIASIGCGSARELLELVSENAIYGDLDYSCVDFEIKALDYIRESLAQFGIENKKHLFINYVLVDLRGLVKNRLENNIKIQQDLIYVSGLFDYLSAKISVKIIAMLFDLVKNGGELILVNAGQLGSEFRAYYELLGEWEFHHRSEVELLEWISGLKGVESFGFEALSPASNYLFLQIKKTK